MRLALITCIMLLFAAQAGAQAPAAGESVFSDYLNPSQEASFLSIRGLSFNSSVGFAYQSWGQHGSDGFGYYMGHFSYRVTRGLTLNWDVGVRSSMMGPDSGQDMQLYLPNLDLTYRPNDKMMIKLQFNQYNYMGRSPYYRYLR
ncbi:MAG TPA: hypothetical protein VLA34_07445 [Candidatus Krumholzibacterium sp.]|nr:hypothetical protein [Candidatus Krumholzibacterium sp.]